METHVFADDYADSALPANANLESINTFTRIFVAMQNLTFTPWGTKLMRILLRDFVDISPRGFKSCANNPLWFGGRVTKNLKARCLKTKTLSSEFILSVGRAMSSKGDWHFFESLIGPFDVSACRSLFRNAGVRSLELLTF